jgi:hypothetical protein
MSEPLVAVVGLKADAIGVEGFEGVFDFPERRIDLEQQAEAAFVIARHFCTVVVAGPHHPFGTGRLEAEPGAGRGGNREHAGCDAVPVEFLNGLGLGPADLICEVGNLARVLPIEPGLPIVRRIEMMMGIDHLGLGALATHRAGRQEARRAKRRRAGEDMTPGYRHTGWRIGGGVF